MEDLPGRQLHLRADTSFPSLPSGMRFQSTSVISIVWQPKGRVQISLRIGLFLPGGYIRALNSRTLRKGTMALEYIGSNLAIAT